MRREVRRQRGCSTLGRGDYVSAREVRARQSSQPDRCLWLEPDKLGERRDERGTARALASERARERDGLTTNSAEGTLRERKRSMLP